MFSKFTFSVGLNGMELSATDRLKKSESFEGWTVGRVVGFGLGFIDNNRNIEKSAFSFKYPVGVCKCVI